MVLARKKVKSAKCASKTAKLFVRKTYKKELFVFWSKVR